MKQKRVLGRVFVWGALSVNCASPMDGGDDDKRVEPADIIDLPRKSREFGEVGSLPISSPSLQLLWWETYYGKGV
ncbi:hypothetical protein NPIL_217311 [Nephila pilipes]|uniref:Uncharacterized protein n=1 Tax=Nephila pilipes TaxID=299642 RepID=A0A8X6PC02_NEPPI|nr:hypothetical protein NPIL_217311 [Nephila pilipes]